MDGKSTVSILSDAQATQLEPLRAALAPAFDALEQAGVPRSSLALAFPFTTQSEATLLDQLHGASARQVPGCRPSDRRARTRRRSYKGAATAAGIPIGTRSASSSPARSSRRSP